MKTDESQSACPKCGAQIPADAPRGLCPQCVFAEALTVNQPEPLSGSSFEAPSLKRVAAEFPMLEILELVGRGGMGFVFKARQPHLDRLVALKLLPEQLAHDPQFAERFNREGRVLAKLNHPNIVTVFDFGRTAGFYYLILEFVDGVNLRQAMQAGRFSPREALQIVPSICEALQYAHEKGVLHRDIKPENILLDSKGHVKIADFGIAKLVHEDPTSVTLTGTGAALGTPHYMAPEQFEAPSGVDHRADIYSLGVVFYEMLTGELPIGRFEPPSAKTPVGKPVDDLVFRTLEKDREKRFQSAGEVKTQVEHLTNSGAAEPEAADFSDEELEELRGKTSFRSVAGAALVGTSLVQPLVAWMAPSTGKVQLMTALLAVAMPGLGGTLVGWLGLNEIRDSNGRLRGLPFALFATLTWPLLALVVLVLGYTSRTFPQSGLLLRLALLLLPAGVLTFSFWAIYSTARWAMRKPKCEERGALKWIFVAVLVAGMAMAARTRSRLQLEQGPVAAAPQPSVRVEPMFQPMQPAADRLREFTWRFQLRELAAVTGKLIVTSNQVPVEFLPNSFSIGGPIESLEMRLRASVRSRGVISVGQPAWDLAREIGGASAAEPSRYVFNQTAPVRWWVAASPWPAEYSGTTNFGMILLRGVQETDPGSEIQPSLWEARYVHAVSSGIADPLPALEPSTLGSVEFKWKKAQPLSPDKIITSFELLHRGGCKLVATLFVQKESGMEFSAPAVEKGLINPIDRLLHLDFGWKLPAAIGDQQLGLVVRRVQAEWEGKSITLREGEELVLFDEVLEDGTSIQGRLRAVKE